MSDRHSKDTIIAAVMERLTPEGPQAMADVITALMNMAMRMERGQFLGARHGQRVPEKRGYANGTKSNCVDTQSGARTLDIAKTAGMDEPYCPQVLECCRAVMLAVAEMYVKGVRASDAERGRCGAGSLSHTYSLALC